MQLQRIDGASWHETVRAETDLHTTTDLVSVVLADRSFPETTGGMKYRRLAYEWSGPECSGSAGENVWRTPRGGSLRRRNEQRVLGVPASPISAAAIDSFVARTLDSWPRLMQVASIGIAFWAAIFASAHIVSAATGLAIGFVGLALLFFGNFAAFRRGDAARLVGPTIAVLGTWGSLMIAVAIGVNALFGA